MYQTIASSGLFDPAWYRRTQVAGASALVDPIWHYISRGWTRSLDPSPAFSTGFYLRWNKDVRGSGVNPLDHYINYGAAEGRPPVQPLAAWLPPALAALQPIKFYAAIGGTKRLTLVIDQSTPDRWGGDRALLLSVAAWVAHAAGRTLRVLLREGQAPIARLDHDLLAWPPGVQRPEVTSVPAGREYSDIAVYDDEVFLATSFSSAHALHQARGGRGLGYLVLDDEASRLPSGEARRLASAALQLSGVTFLSVSSIANTLLTRAKTPSESTILSEGLNLGWFVSTAPAEPTNQVVVLTSNDADYSHLRMVLHALEKAVVEGVLDPATLRLAGGHAPQALLAGTHLVGHLGPRNLADEIGWVRASALIIALTNSGGAHAVAELARHLDRPVVSEISPGDSEAVDVDHLTTLITSALSHPATAGTTATKASLEAIAAYAALARKKLA